MRTLLFVVIFGVTAAVQAQRQASPADSVVSPQTANGEAEADVSVFRLTADGTRAQRVTARFGKASVNEVHVLAGLEPGDRIIVSDISRWRAYDELRIR